MELKLGPEIISSYKRLAYQAWYALAEFVDNSTQAYFNNKTALDREYTKTSTKLTVEITVGKDGDGDFIRIKDNSIGMSESELRNAVTVGHPPSNISGRSKYGLGLKTGACWFGDYWTVKTKKLGRHHAHKIVVDVPRVAKGNLDLHHKKSTADLDEHYTIIEIRKLHKVISARTVGKVKDHLRSLFRVDIREELMVLKWNGKPLTWDSDVDKRLLRGEDGGIAKKRFKFRIGRKVVHGWAGVLAKGSRKEAGFSVIQSNRVIIGWPNSYRPSTIFGDQDGGSNDLVNQRLMGEIFLKGFEVSHTKDQVLYEGDDQEVLENKLRRELAGLRQMARTHRRNVDERVRVSTDVQRAAALNRLEAEIESTDIRDFLRDYEVPSENLVKKSNEILKEGIVKRLKPDLCAKINKLEVSLYLVKDMSPYDPYVLTESTESESSVIVIINLSHPHWSQLTKDESILNFIRHCTYDGVSEWKAYRATGKIQPDTVKLIKDNLLRIPMQVA